MLVFADLPLITEFFNCPKYNTTVNVVLYRLVIKCRSVISLTTKVWYKICKQLKIARLCQTSTRYATTNKYFVARYGLPVNFQAMLLHPNKKNTKKLRDTLQQMYGHLDSSAQQGGHAAQDVSISIRVVPDNVSTIGKLENTRGTKKIKPRNFLNLLSYFYNGNTCFIVHLF